MDNPETFGTQSTNNQNENHNIENWRMLNLNKHCRENRRDNQE